MYDKILCIFPIDPTTDFLNPIPSLMKDVFSERFCLFRVDSNEHSYLKALYLMENSNKESLILYLGHGSNMGFHCIQATAEDDYENCIFLNSQNIVRINGKTIFALSCKSADFLGRFSKSSNQWLGFGDLPTEVESFPLDSENKLDFIEKYKQIIVESVSQSIIELIRTKDLSRAYSNLKLHLNQKMIRLVQDRSCIENRLLAEIIFNTKIEIKYSKEN